MPVRVDPELCCACGGCVDACASDALATAGAGVLVLSDRCIGCGACVGECPNGALSLPE